MSFNRADTLTRPPTTRPGQTMGGGMGGGGPRGGISAPIGSGGGGHSFGPPGGPNAAKGGEYVPRGKAIRKPPEVWTFLTVGKCDFLQPAVGVAAILNWGESPTTKPPTTQTRRPNRWNYVLF